MLFLAQSAGFFLILYKLPVLGNVGSESKLAVAVASSVLASSALILILDAIAAPSRVHHRLMDCIKKQHNVITSAFDSEAKIRLIAALHDEGLTLYRTVRPADEYIAAMDAWTVRAREALLQHASASDMFQFNYAGYGLEYTFEKEVDHQWAMQTHEKRMSYSGKINALKALVEFPSSMVMLDFMGAEKASKDGHAVIRNH